MVSPVEIFCCYAHKDQSLLNELKIHLSPLQRRGLITIWSDIDIDAGTVWEEEIKKHLNTAQIILLLISPDFMASEYCYSTEMRRALERHEQKEAHVIPILLRPTIWKGAPFDKLQMLPTNAKPVTDRRSWLSEDEVLNDVAEGIRKVIETLGAPQTPKYTEINVTSHSLGLVIWIKDQSTGHGREVIWNLIQVNDPVPVSQTKILRTNKANQEMFELKLVENTVQADQVDDKSMGEEIGYAILHLPPKLPINAPIEVTFELSQEGRLHIIGREPTSNSSIETTIETEHVQQRLTWKDD